ncbi:Growth/differentiation factor 9 [Gossypium arboreum]|uniref:Growth/differentiation factor 9 n=1 Tax=Gossypium arboreum TaxID=29729 RepID=A0A0B0N891_GOSAR|nr:Growth/differentiation factor 9 [Gossypium arboreum]
MALSIPYSIHEYITHIFHLFTTYFTFQFQSIISFPFHISCHFNINYKTLLFIYPY